MDIAIKLNIKINSPNVSAIKQKIISETAEKIHNQEGNTMQLTNDTDKMLCLIYDEFLNRKKVAVVPGTAFGDCGEGFLRISYAYSIEQLKEAMGRLERFIGRLREQKTC